MSESTTTIRPASRTQGSEQIPQFQSEIDQYYMAMQSEFSEVDVRSIMSSLAGMSARASHMRALIIRNEGRVAKTFRIGQIDPFLAEVDRQFKTWSRYQSVVQMEFDASKGGV